MTTAELREDAYIRAGITHVTGGGYIETYQLEKREPNWLAEDGWWATNGARLTSHGSGYEKRTHENDAPVSSLRLEKFDTFAQICSGCFAGMNEGWFCCGETFCSQTCLDKSFKGTGETWEEHYDAVTSDDGSGDCYWTEWEESEDAVPVHG